MATFKYKKYKISINPESKKNQGVKTGDVVRREFYISPHLYYSLMIVLETGVDIIGEEESPYFIGALIAGNDLYNGEILDFVRITNLFDTKRSGALYLTTSDSEAPYLDVIDGMAREKSLCYPEMDGGNPDVADDNKYSCCGDEYFNTTYKRSEQEVNRIYRLTRNSGAYQTGILGVKQSIVREVKNPERLIISFKARGSKAMSNVPLSFGYTNGQEVDGSGSIDVATLWEYKLFMVTVDFPPQYQRSFLINLTSHLTTENDWFEIADLNIILQSEITTLKNATKTRVGKVKGIIDPVFGILDGYGAYFQNLYATKNVNIAGTLTAGDENGFSSTFYVGKIHKNVIRNSIDCLLEDTSAIEVAEQSPVGIGKVWQTGTNATLEIQTKEWRNNHTGEKYVFSFWLKAGKGMDFTLSVYQDGYHAGNLNIVPTGDWVRYHIYFFIKESDTPNMKLHLEASLPGMLITAPQLEAGTTPSQYQPTDKVLSYVEDYGAWFSKGGIGGTIQNPLLKLNENGSICSKDKSFVINPDGTGHFADGRFKWEKDKIILEDVAIQWESPVTVEIASQSGLIIQNDSHNVDAKAILFQDGREIDKTGTAYLYAWKLWNSTGTSVIKEYEGKSIIVLKDDISGKGTLWCEVSEK